MEEPVKDTEDTLNTETRAPITEMLNTETVNNKAEAASSSLSLQTSALSADTLKPVKRKRGRPRKESRQTIPAEHLAGTSVESRRKELIHSLQSESIEDPAEGETDNEAKPKRNRRSKVLHDDYVADFNTSDEEDGSEVFHRFSGRGRGRGRGLKHEFPEAFDDFFSSYNELFGKRSATGDEGVDGSIFEDLEECGDDEQNLPKEDQLQDSPRRKHEANDVMEGVIGPNGQTRIRIASSRETTIIDGVESLIYNVTATTGERRSVTPLAIPKTASDMGSGGNNNSALTPFSPSCQTGNDGEGTATSTLAEASSKSSVSSRMMQNKQQKDRTFLRQVASLKHKYYQALQELKKRPQVATLADLVYGAANFLTEDQLIFFTLQLKSGCPNRPGVKFSVREKMLALAIYLESPALYKWLGSIFHLPSKLILERWLDSVARNDPDDAKKIVYNVYTRHIFKA